MSTAVADDIATPSTDETLSALYGTVATLMFDSLKHEQRKIGELTASLKKLPEGKLLQNVYAEMRSHLGKIQSVFEKLVQDACSGFTESENIPTDRAVDFCSNELALITDSELKQQLLLEKAFNDACVHFDSMRAGSGHKYLPLGHALPSDNVMYSIEPGALAWALQHAIASLIEDKTVVRVIYRFVGARFFAGVNHVYDDATPTLAAIVARHKPADGFGTESRVDADSLADLGDFGETGDMPDALASRPDIFQLLRQSDIPSPTSDHRHDGLNDISLDQLRPDTEIRTLSVDEVITILRRHAADGRGEDLREVLRDALGSISSNNVIGTIDRVCENVLNLVSHLFTAMQEDNDLIPAVRKQLKRLQSPVTEVALTDPEFFQSDEHPVRHYLNLAGHLGSLVTSEEDDHFRRLRNNINTLFKAYDGDPAIFSAATRSLRDAIENTHDASVAIQAGPGSSGGIPGMRVAPVHDFLESMASLLSHELSFHKVTRFVFLSILSKTLIRHGVESAEWKHVTGVYRNILWSTQASADDEGKRLVLRSLPGIVRDMRALCEAYGVKASVREMLLNRMCELHVMIIHGQDGALIEESDEKIREAFDALRGRVLEDDPAEMTGGSHRATRRAIDLPRHPAGSAEVRPVEESAWFDRGLEQVLRKLKLA
jgi:hypothetical protein